MNNKLLFIALMFCGLIIIIDLIMSVRNSKTFEEFDASVDHTYSVLKESDEVFNLVTNVQIGDLRYIITGDSGYLKYIKETKNKVAEHIYTLRKLTKDNASQQPPIDSLELFAGKRIQFSGVIFESKKENNFLKRNQLIEISKGYIDSVKSFTEKINNAENILLNQRKEVKYKSIASINSAFYVLVFAVSILLIVVLLIIRRNAALEIKITQRTSELVSQNKELESFSYSVSHDLRSPLRAINGFTQVLAEDYVEQLDDEAKSLLNEIILNSNKMGELIDNLLEFSRIGKQHISMVNVNIKQLVNSVISELKQLEPKRIFTLNIKNLENIKGDRNMLKQVFINLISNAFKYTGKKKEAIIEIGSYGENNAYTYYVKDNGAGFDMQYYDKLFGVFQRLHSSSEFDGTGVGLAIVQKIILKHQGKLWAEGKVDEGACFYISLPNSSRDK